MTTTDVLVIGAGPAGMALALTLLENGVKVRLIEKMPTTRIGSRGNGIHPRTLEALKFLGVVDEVIADATPEIVMQPYMPGGIEKLPIHPIFPKKEATPAIPYPNAVGFGQDLLEAVLSKALFDRFGVKIEHMKELTSFKSMKDKVIAQLIATNLDGTTSTETAEAKYLVGTDGGRSRVRKELGFAFEGETLGGALILGDIQMNGIDHKVSHTWNVDGIGRIVLIPASQRPGHPLALRMMLSMKADEHFDPDAFIKDRDAVRRRIEDIIERKDITAGEFTYLAVYRPHARMVDRFSDGGRVFLAGDAAHCHSPAGGQGLNSSVLDSVNLGWKLAAAIHGHAAPTLLDSYSEERVPVIASMLNRTSKIMRDKAAAPPANGLPRFDQNLNQLGIHYAWSSIIVDDLGKVIGDETNSGEVDAYTAGAELHAGDRAPNATGLVSVVKNEETSLFDLVSIRSHLGVVFILKEAKAQEIASMLDAINSIGGHLVRPVLVCAEKPGSVYPSASQVFVDRDGHAFAAYKPQRYGSVSAAIIRPDVVVGAMISDPKSVKVYFGKIYV